MLDSYVSTLAYTDEQANAVAKLCFDLGAAVNMDYASSASGAQMPDIPYASAASATTARFTIVRSTTRRHLWR